MRSRALLILRSRRAPRPSDEASAREQRLIHLTAFAEAAYQAWFATALEQTKSVFALATAGVGLTMTLVFGMAENQPSMAPMWLMLAACSFGISSALCIAIFRSNTRIANLIARPSDHGDEARYEKDEAALTRAEGFVRRQDLLCRMMFGAGLLFSLFALIAKIYKL